jgi:2-keto-4-pentenoate hydratase/2-oxohepta-3-ene-1,7-dioic acid hydratase in catechol pathway
MRIIRYTVDDGLPAFGCVRDGVVFALAGDPLGSPEPDRRVAPLEAVTLLEPCRPGKVVAVAVNFDGIEGFSPTMTEPLVLVKPTSSVCGPGTDVVNPFPDLPWWGEAELGVVVKHRLRCASAAEVSDGVLGFTIGNDVTVDNIEHRDHHLARSKCPDHFCPLGPWIDTKFDASDCLIEAVQNDEVIRRARSGEQFWQWPRILQELSQWITLEPWDVVLTGNPPDTVGMRFLEHGDRYTARIAGLGELTNRFYVRGRPRPGEM